MKSRSSSPVSSGKNKKSSEEKMVVKIDAPPHSGSNNMFPSREDYFPNK